MNPTPPRGGPRPSTPAATTAESFANKVVASLRARGHDVPQVPEGGTLTAEHADLILASLDRAQAAQRERAAYNKLFKPAAAGPATVTTPADDAIYRQLFAGRDNPGDSDTPRYP